MGHRENSRNDKGLRKMGEIFKEQRIIEYYKRFNYTKIP